MSAWVNAVRGESPKYLRVPAWAAKNGVPNTVPTLPLDPSQVPFDDPSVFYGIRLCDSFLDPLALWNGERGYVRSALLRFQVALVAPTGGKDPLLILSRLRAAPLQQSAAIRGIVFLNAPAAAEDMQPPPAEYFYAVQPLSGTLSAKSPLVNEAAPMQFKSFSVAAATPTTRQNTEDELEDLVRKGLAGAMPREALVTADFAARVLQAKPGREGSTQTLAAALVRAGASFIFFQGKAAVRAMFREALAPDSAKKLCEATPEIDSAFLENHTFFYKKKNDKVVVKRVDGNPITATAAKMIEQTLRLKSVKLDSGALLGLTGRARLLHDTVLANLFSIRWLGAAEPTKKNNEGDETENADEENAAGNQSEANNHERRHNEEEHEEAGEPEQQPQAQQHEPAAENEEAQSEGEDDQSQPEQRMGGVAAVRGGGGGGRGKGRKKPSQAPVA